MGASKDGRALHRPWVRASIIAVGAVVVAAAAIGGGMWATADDPDLPGGDDTHTAAPTCAAVPEDTLAEVLPGAVLETDDQGPLNGGENTVCVWSTAGATDGDGTILRVDLSARFTDASAEPAVSGDEAAAMAHQAMVPARGEAVELPGAAGAEVWRGQLPGTAELAFHTTNLFVRVTYTGESDGDPISFEDARDTAVDVATRIGEAL